jgi:hypothetical protein
MSQPPNPLTPMFIGVLLGAAVLLFGGGISSILTTRELARIQAQENIRHCRRAIGTREWDRYGCGQIEWGDAAPDLQRVSEGTTP